MNRCDNISFSFIRDGHPHNSNFGDQDRQEQWTTHLIHGSNAILCLFLSNTEGKKMNRDKCAWLIHGCWSKNTMKKKKSVKRKTWWTFVFVWVWNDLWNYPLPGSCFLLSGLEPSTAELCDHRPVGAAPLPCTRDKTVYTVFDISSNTSHT